MIVNWISNTGILKCDTSFAVRIFPAVNGALLIQKNLGLRVGVRIKVTCCMGIQATSFNESQ